MCGNQISTQSCDRSVIVYHRNLSGKGDAFRCLTTNTKIATAARLDKLYVDENRTNYFRRLVYTPDGTLLITPAGRYEAEDGSEASTLYVFRTSAPSQPVLRLKGLESTVVAIRCCPMIFQLRPEAPSVIFSELV